jgi:hypothetical protein
MNFPVVGVRADPYHRAEKLAAMQFWAKVCANAWF